MEKKDLPYIEVSTRRKVNKAYKGITTTVITNKRDVDFIFNFAFGVKVKEVKVNIDYSMLPFFYKQELIDKILDLMEQGIKEELIKEYRKNDWVCIGKGKNVRYLVL